MRIVLLSGPVAAGKSSLAVSLAQRMGGAKILKTRTLLHDLLAPEPDRQSFQKAGDRLDRRTAGKWVSDGLIALMATLREDTSVIVDSVRIEQQISAIRKAFGPSVVHVHLTAPLETLKVRYNRRRRRAAELRSYDDVRSDPTEAQVESLADVADVVVNTARSSQSDVEVRVASFLRLYGGAVTPLVDVLIGGSYGSEGKGHIASYLAPEYQVLVRVGGPNAGHTVYGEPEAYTFHHLPSGSARNPTAQLILGPGSVLWLDSLLKEISDNEVSVDRLGIDPQAMVIEKADRRWEERSLTGTIASTAQGVGRASARKLLRGGLRRPKVRLAKDIRLLRPYVRESRKILDDAFARGSHVCLEGTQGTGLSLHHGTYPYVTSRDTTVSGCLAEAGIAPSRVRRTIIVCRSYPIRVQNPPGGTSGPMTNEISWAEIARRSEIPVKELRGKEKTSTTRRRRRVGEFDWCLLRKAVSLNGPSDVALTFVDYLSIRNRAARRFEQLTYDTIQFIEEIERVSAAPVSLITTRFHFRSIIDRRAW